MHRTSVKYMSAEVWGWRCGGRERHNYENGNTTTFDHHFTSPHAILYRIKIRELYLMRLHIFSCRPTCSWVYVSEPYLKLCHLS